MKGILGRKIGMTQVFTKEGKLIPVTVVEVLPNVVTQVKTTETDGYEAIQLGVVDKKEKNATKASIGHAKKANTNPKRYLKEIRNAEGTYNLGDTITASIFEAGEYVDVTGTTKGHGTQGVIKRHGQHSGPSAHGSRYHRRPGSMGTLRPMRVLKGKKLPGHMGVETVTIQNLEIIEANANENYILVSGNIPGAKESLVLIKSAVKKDKKNAEEILNYVEETVVDEVVEETPAEDAVVEEVTEEATPETEEAPVEEATEEVVEEPATEEESTNEASNEGE